MTQTLYTVAYISSSLRVPFWVVKSALTTLNAEPVLRINETEHYSQETFDQVAVGIAAGGSELNTLIELSKLRAENV